MPGSTRVTRPFTTLPTMLCSPRRSTRSSASEPFSRIATRVSPRDALIRISFCMGPGPEAGEPVAGSSRWSAPEGRAFWRGARVASGSRLSGFRAGRKRSWSSQFVLGSVSIQIRATRSVAGRLAQEFSFPVGSLAVSLRRSRPRVGSWAPAPRRPTPSLQRRRRLLALGLGSGPSTNSVADHPSSIWLGARQIPGKASHPDVGCSRFGVPSAGTFG